MPLDEDYFVWLYSQVGEVDLRNRAQTYWSLLKIFHEKEFTWTRKFEKDGNRAQAGKDLRKEFLRQTNTRISNRSERLWMDEGCSVLEMMVALSFKLAWDGEGQPADWFWQMIDNLGLTECTDANPPDEMIINIVLDKVINREYGENGAGGLFPLTNTHEDQRDVELWYQAEAYLLERI